MGQGDINIDLPDGLSFAPAPERVAAFEGMIPAERFHLGRRGTDRAAWERISTSSLGPQLLQLATRAAARDPLPRVSDSIYVSCLRDHSPAAFNARAPDARERMVLLPLAECIEQTGEWLPLIEQDIEHTLALTSWVHPNNDEDLDTFEGRTIFNDLTSLHAASSLVASDYLLGDRLSADMRADIRREVTRRTLDPFRQRIESGQDVYWWLTVSHNWNSVCLLHTVACALWLHDDVRDRAWYLALAEQMIEHSEQGFTETGFYTEGVGYWAYGFGCYAALAELVRTITDGAIDWMSKPKIKRTARYGQRMEIQNGVYPSFADCRRDVELPDWLVHWPEARIGGASKPPAVDPLSGRPLRSTMTAMMVLFHLQEEATEHGQSSSPTLPLRDWYEDVQFLISRPSPDAAVPLAATFKGGTNGVNHNHNDIGTFTVLIGERELLADPGAEVYTERTFSRQRYEGDLLNSFGHPVPVVAGQRQPPHPGEYTVGVGKDVYAEVVDTSFSDDGDRVVLDLRKAYRVEGLQELTRTYVYRRGDGPQIEVTDHVRFDKPQSFETALITFAQWDSSADGSLRIHDGDAALRVQVTCDAGPLEFSHAVIQESSTPTRLSWRVAGVTKATVVVRVMPDVGEKT